MTTERYDMDALNFDTRSTTIRNEQIHNRVADALALATKRVTGQWIAMK